MFSARNLNVGRSTLRGHIEPDTAMGKDTTRNKKLPPQGRTSRGKD